MIIQDDRTAEEKKTHNWLVIGTDKFMSCWGRATGGKSIAAWACTFEHLDAVEKWVKSRPDMLRVRISNGKNYRPKIAKHYYVYVVHEDHPALTKG